jgi:hypothetical protein
MFRAARLRLPSTVSSQCLDEGEIAADRVTTELRLGKSWKGRWRAAAGALFKPARPGLGSGEAADLQDAVRPRNGHRIRRIVLATPKSWRAAAINFFEPVRLRLQSDGTVRNQTAAAAATDRDKAQCVEYVARNWRLYVVLQQQYRPLSLAENVDKFARSIMRDLANNFDWAEQETKIQILAIVFAAIIRSGTHAEDDTRAAIKEIWPRLLEEVRWPI